MSISSVNAAVLSDWSGIMDCHKDRIGLPKIKILKEPCVTSRTPRVNLKSFVSTVQQVGECAGRSSVAWNAGQNANYGTRGQVGKAVIGARTLRTALQRLQEYFPLLQDDTALELEIDESWACLSYKILDPSIWPRHEDAMYSLGLYASLIKAAAPGAWSHTELTVEAEAYQVRADIERIVEASVIHGGPANILRFPTKILDCELDIVQPAPPELLNDLRSQLAKKKRSMSLTHRVRNMIFQYIAERSLGQEEVARELGVSSRTLRRKLAQGSLSYQQLLDECRMEYAALEFRIRESVLLSELALKLSYSEHSTFSRAFKRWSGMTPQDYRQSMSIH